MGNRKGGEREQELGLKVTMERWGKYEEKGDEREAMIKTEGEWVKGQKLKEKKMG